MVFLLITILSIALVGSLGLATLYYGGSAYEKAADSARASMLLNQGRQIEAAARAYYDDRGSWPTGLTQLVSLRYLKEYPSVGSVQWATAVAGEPVYFLAATAKTTLPTCAEYNSRSSLRLRAVPGSAYADLPSLCYGPADALVVVLNAGGNPTSAPALAALPPPTVPSGSLPDPGFTDGWTQAPAGATPGAPPSPAPLTWYYEGLGLDGAAYLGGAGWRPNGFQLINRGDIQAGAADFEIQGPGAEHFRIQSVTLMRPLSARSDGTDVVCGTSVSPQKWTGCVADDPSVGPNTDFRIVVEYRPQAVGTFTAELAATSTNGRTDLPAPLGPLVVTGCAGGSPTCP